MLLNNDNGHIVVLDKIDVINNFCIFSEYENTVCKDVLNVKVQSRVHYFTGIVLKTYLNQLINFYELCYTNLQSELFTDYVVSSDTQNWLFPSRPIRTTVLNSLIIANVKPIDNSGTLSPLGTLIERVKVQHYDYYMDNNMDKTTVIYFLTFDPADYAIILPFLNNGIYPETKL